jgi:hypothetical protein
MIKIDFPAPSFRIQTKDDYELIFDELRKQWVKLTPEEWVRQNFVQYIIQTKKYPATLIGIEKELKLGELKKRFDLLVYTQQHQPWMLVECKAMHVQLTADVLEQAIRYHMAIPVNYLVLTNGSYTFCWAKKEGRFIEQTELPHHE